MTDAGRLLVIKIVHTVVWAVVAGCIVGLYPLVVLDRLDWFVGLHAVIGAEILALAIFRWKCPLTYLAERYTERREPNFDIFLPLWLARWNKEVFTTILVGAWIAGLVRWVA